MVWLVVSVMGMVAMVISLVFDVAVLFCKQWLDFLFGDIAVVLPVVLAMDL